MAASTWRAIYNMHGDKLPTFSYPIATSEAWSVGSVVAWNSAGALFENTTDSTDNLGLALETVSAGVNGGPITDLCSVIPFAYGVVYAVKNAANLSDTPVATDIGTIADLDLDATNGWGILVDTGSTSGTPTFRIVDIDTIRNEWHVVIAPLEEIDVFQWLDAAA